MQSAIGADAINGPDVFSNYSTEIALAATSDQLVDRVNLLLMASEMDATLRSQVLAAVNRKQRRHRPRLGEPPHRDRWVLLPETCTAHIL